VWRYNANPIIPRDAIPTSNSIFNSSSSDPRQDSIAGYINKIEILPIYFRGYMLLLRQPLLPARASQHRQR